MRKEYYKQRRSEFVYLPMSEAKSRGYVPYSTGYKPITEGWMLQNAVTDILKNGRDKYALVKIGNLVEIWIIPSFYRKGWIDHVSDKTTTDADETSEAIQNMEAEGAPIPQETTVSQS